MSIRCGYCYRYGHTKMGCPKAKERVDKHLEAYKELKAKEPTPSLWDISRRFDWGYKTREAFELYENQGYVTSAIREAITSEAVRLSKR